MNTVLVTGGSGFIGYHLVKELIAHMYRVLILDNLSNSHKALVDELENNKSVKETVLLHRNDIRNKTEVKNIFQLEHIDACILGAKTDIQDSVIRPEETLDVNVNGTLSILQACRANHINNFVFASSAAVYGRPKMLPVKEEHITLPLSPYGASKVAGEALVSSFSSEIINCQILRFFNVYGKGQTSAYGGVIIKFIERLHSLLPPIVYGTGHQTRVFIHVSDVVRAIILALRYQKGADVIDNYNIFNIATGKPTSILDLAVTMIDIFGLREKIKPIHSDPLAGDIIHSCGDIKKVKDLLKFEAVKDLRSGLEQQIIP